jgi:hypothetical protein
MQWLMSRPPQTAVILPQGVADGVVTSENTSASVTLAVLGANNTSGTQHMTVLNWIVRKEY